MKTLQHVGHASTKWTLNGVALKKRGNENMNPDRPERVDRTLIHNGAIVDIYQDKMQLPDGSFENFQYRNAIDSYTLEIPAGGLNGADEPTKVAAHRELEEETGYYAEMEDVEFLLSLYTTVAFCNEKIDIYVARNLRKTAQHLDDDEFIDVEVYTPDELRSLILEGKIVDAKTIAGLSTYLLKMSHDN